MPYPTQSEKSDEDGKSRYMGRCIHYLKNEGKKQDQAIAQCLSMWKQDKEAKGGEDPEWEEREVGPFILLD